MKNFLEKLMALRGNVGRGVKKAGRGVANLAKGTIANMGNLEERYQQIDETARARNRALVEDEGESFEEYETRTAPRTPEEEALTQPGYAKLLRKLLGEL